ncbi:MAG TPA: tRNA (adenosine(37)-N6)-dimethylallyltransferase MiaA [Candidatus Baltobacteraceae bacterium]
MSASGVLILAGPTASGKSELAIALATRFDAEIVGADSRQIYRGMPIGTAAPTPAQRAAVPHHLVDFLDPHERYSAARFAHDATRAIEEIHSRGKRAIVVGGTGFYIRALTGDVGLAPQYDAAVRDRLAREARLHPPEFLHGWLAARDPRRAAMLSPADTYRVTRALEVALADGVAARDDAPARGLRAAGIPFLKVGLDVPLPEIDERIARRTDAMFEAGLIDEAERIGADAVAADAVGYPQALAYLRGWSTDAEMRATLARATRRYARRQRSWLRSEPDLIWARASSVAALARERLAWT